MPTPNTRVMPGFSATAQTNPPQAGVRQAPPPLKQLVSMLESTTNELRMASSMALNPQSDPTLVASLTAQAASLQADAHNISLQIDAAAQVPDARLGVYQALTNLSGRVHAFAQAVADNVGGVHHGLRTTGPRMRLGNLLPDDPEARTKRIWMLFGAGCVVVAAGYGIWYMRQSKPVSKFKGLPGALPAR